MTFVLIHGAWHGGWCWYKVIPLLEKEGHKVLAPDLPGHGSDKTPISGVSLRAYADKVCQILDSESESVKLVGHSMGGAVITQAAEYKPEQIDTLIYLSAYLLRNGESVFQAAEADRQSLLSANAVLSDDRSSVTIKDEAIREVFYGDCCDDDVTLARSSLVPQATAAVVAPVSTTDSNFGRVRRVYISCLRDRTITPACQESMYKSLPCDKVVYLDTCHSPFFSAPAELAEILLSL